LAEIAIGRHFSQSDAEDLKLVFNTAFIIFSSVKVCQCCKSVSNDGYSSHELPVTGAASIIGMNATEALITALSLK
jgi:hypothetical protein